MVRRVIEEDVTTPSTTVVHEDGSWVGRTIVTLVVLALVVAGAIWLVRTLSDNTGDGGGDTTNNEFNVGDNDTEGGTDQNNTDTTTDTTVPTAVPS